MTPDQLAQLLDELGRRLGPSGEYVFRLAVQRQIVSGLLNAGFGLLFVVGSLTGGVVVARWASAEGQGSFSDRPIGAVLMGLALFAIGLIGCAALYSGVLSLLTPEFSALKEILSTVTGK